MAEGPENLVLDYLRRLDRKVDLLADEIRDLKVRMSSIESVMAAIETNLAGLQRRVDRVEARLERIERRLDLADA